MINEARSSQNPHVDLQIVKIGQFAVEQHSGECLLNLVHFSRDTNWRESGYRKVENTSDISQF